MKKNNNKGFTFIELILYMAILGIFMVAVMTLITTTVASHKKQESRQKLQSQATETYDTIANMIMGAKDLRVASHTESDSVVKGYVVPAADAVIESNGKIKDVLPMSVTNGVTGSTDIKSFDCYDIAGIPGDSDVDYLLVRYSSGNDTTSFCTIKYDSSAKVLYMAKAKDSSSGDSMIKDSDLKSDPDLYVTYNKLLDEGTTKGTILAKNVTGFKITVNSQENSVSLTIDFKDANTNESYSVTGAVGIRNSFVLTKHEWN